MKVGEARNEERKIRWEQGGRGIANKVGRKCSYEDLCCLRYVP
jgi:hypothetical protein